jgi:hypothetical protein
MNLNCRNITGCVLLLLLLVPTGCVTTSRSPDPEATPSPEPGLTEAQKMQMHENLATFLKPKGFTIDEYSPEGYPIYVTAPKVAIYASPTELKEFALSVRNRIQEMGYDRQVTIKSPAGQTLAETKWLD